MGRNPLSVGKSDTLCYTVTNHNIFIGEHMKLGTNKKDNKNSGIIETLSKHGLPYESFTLGFKHNWYITTNISDIKATLSESISVNSRENNVYYEINGNKHCEESFEDELQNVIDTINFMESFYSIYLKYKTISYLTGIYNSELEPTKQQLAFLENLLKTRKHPLKIDIFKKISAFIVTVAIDYLKLQPLSDVPAIQEYNNISIGGKDSRKRISTSKGIITILKRTEKDPFKLKILNEIRKLWDVYSTKNT